MAKNRVFLIRNVAPEMYGGGETYQIKLGLMLLKNGFEPFIVTASKELLSDARKNKIKTIKSPYIYQQNWSGWKNFLFPIYCVKIIKLRWWYKKIFEKYEPTVINVQSRDDWIATTRVAKRMGIKVLWTDHADFRSWVLINVNVWYKNWIGKWILRCAKRVNKIIFISDYEKKIFDNLVGRSRFKNIIVIKNGAKDELEKYQKVETKKHSFCYVGRIVDYKGIEEMIKAFRAVANKYPDVTLNIYGDGEIEKYQKMCEKCSGVVFYGRTDEPLRALAENEIFVLPSYREGLSLSLLDAAMMKKKIIASDVDGNPEVVVNGETGLLVPARNSKKLADAMIWMIKHEKESEGMAENVRKKYEKEFDFEKIFEEKMLALYNSRKEEKK